MRIATASVRTGFAMTVLFFMEAVLRTVLRRLPGEGQREGNFWLNLGEGREVF